MSGIDGFWDDNDEMIREHVETHARNRDRRTAQQEFAHDWLDAREQSQQAEADRIERERDSWRRERYHRTQEALERQGRTKPQITHRQPRTYKLQRVSCGLMGGEWAVKCNNRMTYVGSKQACEMHISINAVADFDQVIR